MSAGHEPTSWRQAARAAPFRPYRPVAPAPRYVYLGGYGYSGATTSHLRIRAVADDGEIDIATEPVSPHATSRALPQLREIVDALRHHLHDHEGGLALPLDLRIEPDDRRVQVDGVERTFHGLRIAGDTRWTGTSVVGECHVTVSTTRSATVVAIEATDADDLDDRPPRSS